MILDCFRLSISKTHTLCGFAKLIKVEPYIYRGAISNVMMPRESVQSGEAINGNKILDGFRARALLALRSRPLVSHSHLIPWIIFPYI